MPAPLSDRKRRAILADIEAEADSCRGIAAKHGVSRTTVSDLAKKNGFAFGRQQTKNATQAVVADSKARRALAASRFLDEVHGLLDQMHQPHLAHNFGGKDNTYAERLMDRPPPAELRNLMTTAAIAFDKHLAGEKHDADTGTEGARSVLGALGDALQVAAARIDGEVTDP